MLFRAEFLLFRMLFVCRDNLQAAELLSKQESEVETLRNTVRQRQESLRPALQKYVKLMQVGKHFDHQIVYTLTLILQDLSEHGVRERLQKSVRETQDQCDAFNLSGDGQEGELDRKLASCIEVAKKLHYRQALLECLSVQP